MTSTRIVMVPIRDLLRVMSDYLPEIPQDAIPLRLETTPEGKFALVLESPSWEEGGEMLIDFQLKRVHPLGGGHFND